MDRISLFGFDNISCSSENSSDMFLELSDCCHF